MPAIKGTTLEATAPIRLIPPKITAAAAPARMMAVSQGEKLYSLFRTSATELAWMELPVPQLANMPKNAKARASGIHFEPRPFLM